MMAHQDVAAILQQQLAERDDEIERLKTEQEDYLGQIWRLVRVVEKQQEKQIICCNKCGHSIAFEPKPIFFSKPLSMILFDNPDFLPEPPSE